MPVFTCITENRDSFHLSQHTTNGPEAALRKHIAAMPYDDGDELLDQEFKWLSRVIEGTESVELLPLGSCRSTWMWRDGALHSPQWHTYIVRTDIDKND